MNNGPDGKPRKDTMLKALEIDAVAMLRQTGGSPKDIRTRLSARMYLLNKGWTIDEINKAKEAEDS